MSYKEELLSWSRQDALTLSEQQLEERVESTISTTFGRVAGLLLLSFGIAYSTAIGLIPLPFSSSLYRVSWIGGLGLVFRMSRRRQKMSYQTLAGLLILFAVLEGFGLTGVFYAYDLGSIYQMFLTSGLMFAGLAVIGYRTKVNVLSVGPILMMGLIGLIIAMVINMFWQNTQFDIRLSVIGLVIFGGFVIYDMHMMKQQALINDRRIPLLMALGLFINFVNIFLFLLRLFGGGSD